MKITGILSDFIVKLKWSKLKAISLGLFQEVSLSLSFSLSCMFQYLLLKDLFFLILHTCLMMSCHQLSCGAAMPKYHIWSFKSRILNINFNLVKKNKTVFAIGTLAQWFSKCEPPGGTRCSQGILGKKNKSNFFRWGA